jgi:hypothetical protein
MTNLSELEVDLLLLFYTFSDQNGRVDMKTAASWAKTKLGVTLPSRQLFIKQKHVDALVKAGLLPDISDVLKKISSDSGITKKRRSKD